jgi:FkbM family methyltransferase
MMRLFALIGGSRRRMKERISALETRINERISVLEARVDGLRRDGDGASQMVVTHAATERLIDIKGIPSFTFCIHGDREDYVSREIGAHGTWEPLETEIVRRLLAHYGLFVDLGANIGWYSTIAKRVMPDGSEIIAFEPEPGNFSVLQRNTALEPGVKLRLEQAAVADVQGHLLLHLSESNQGDHRIHSSEPGRQQVEVKVVTLDGYFSGRDLPPMLLKCDTQGSEPKIVRGADKTIAANLSSSTFIFEFWPFGMVGAGENIEEFVRRLGSWPHRPFIINGERNCLKPIEWTELLARCQSDLAPESQNFVDLLLVVPGTPAFNSVADLIHAD